MQARIADLRAQIAKEEQVIASTDAELVALQGPTLVLLEEYVDSLAVVANLNEEAAVVKDEDSLYRLIVRYGWRGVETVEQAKTMLVEEVARRSVSKGDLGLLLSSIDHTAMLLYRRLPENLKAHADVETFVDAAVAQLETEDFAADLATDSNWVSMRERWVRFGWREVTSVEEFNAAFLREVACRIGDLRRDSGRFFDAILDDELAKVPKTVAAEMTQKFARRLEIEFASLPKRVTESQRSAVADAVQAVETFQAVAETSFKQLPDPSPSPKRSYSDHDLMRRGRDTWNLTYALGMTDEQANEFIESNCPDSPGLTRFAARWAVHAFQRLMTSHTFAAALMCSDVHREVLEGIERQWDAFMVLVPNGMLVAGELEFSRILVATYSLGVEMEMMAIRGNGTTIRSVVTAGLSIPELLSSDGTDLLHGDVDKATYRCFIMAKRLVAGLLLNLQHPPNVKVRKVEARPKSKGREAEPEHRIVTIGAPLTIDCRASVKEYIEHGPRRGKHAPPTVQVMVRGHYRRQVCGVGRLERKVIWISPFWRGPEAALIQTRAKVPG